MAKKPIYIIAITILVIVAICFVAIRPTISVALKSYQDLKVSQDKLKSEQDQKNAIAELAANADQLGVVQSIAQGYIPKDPATSDLVMELTTLANSNSMKIDSTSMDQAKETQKTAAAAEDTTTNTSPTPAVSAAPVSSIKNLGFQLTVEGPFPNFLNFLKGLESGSRLLTVKTMSFQLNTQNNSSNDIQVAVSGTAYYKADVGLTETLTNIKVSADTIKKFLDLKNGSAPFSLPSGADVGRGNPFEGY